MRVSKWWLKMMTPIFGWTISLRALLVVSNIQSKENHVHCFSSLSLSLSSAHTQIAMKSTTQCNSCGLRGSRHMFFIEERILASTPNLQQWEDGITYINSILHRFWSGECSICTMKDTEDKVICWNLTLVCRAVMSIRSRGPLNWSVCVISLAWGRHNRQRSPSSPR